MNKNRRRRYRRLQFLAGLLIFLSFIAGIMLGNMSGSTDKTDFNPSGTVQTMFTDASGDEEIENTWGANAENRNTWERASENTDTFREQEAFTSEWNLILINRDNPLPDNYLIPELTQLRNGHSIDSRVYPALQEMLDDARAAGYEPLICSSYRTREKQEQLFANEIQVYLNQGYSQEEAEEMASFGVAVPGTSEHQAGLAVDIVDMSYQLLDKNQENTPVQQWLMEHCAEYGFILRYPSDKSEITGIKYEPWHYRYVGVEAAKEIMEQGICLEEYLVQ